MVLVELSGIFSHTKSFCFVLNAISVHCELADRASLGLWRSCTDLKVNFYRETMFQERHTLILKRYQMWTSSWMINYRLCEKQWSLKWLISVFISLQLSRILLRKVWMELLSKSSFVSCIKFWTSIVHAHDVMLFFSSWPRFGWRTACKPQEIRK